ncbi:hypothetical protein WH50_22580 [Pokkaliibacter plantistimulans]|uniref:DUF3592 domain-containing protein n=1 Tax=Pokkaliibacter plantistimulans TaxID=1635171 RepID=A0ABX5LUY5_9GAMM|nr:DUF3592 domain-containing protein [Pokkaliibacter plantistimulans]PXF29106.1 hypothetical protein WH50_22580 [Pokkaliibacter plantistimulans]
MAKWWFRDNGIPLHWSVYVAVFVLGTLLMSPGLLGVYSDYRINHHLRTATATVVGWDTVPIPRLNSEYHTVRYVFAVDGQQYGCTTLWWGGGWCRIDPDRWAESKQTKRITIDYDAELPFLNRAEADNPQPSFILGGIVWLWMPLMWWTQRRESAGRWR